MKEHTMEIVRRMRDEGFFLELKQEPVGTGDEWSAVFLSPATEGRPFGYGHATADIPGVAIVLAARNWQVSELREDREV